MKKYGSDPQSEEETRVLKNEEAQRKLAEVKEKVLEEEETKGCGEGCGCKEDA